jgi:lysyl-tRNA synthetase, class II
MANMKGYETSEIFTADITKIKRGDIIGVRGHPTRTKTGELSIVPKKMELLSPCLHALPHYYGLKDKVRRLNNNHSMKCYQ